MLMVNTQKSSFRGFDIGSIFCLTLKLSRCGGLARRLLLGAVSVTGIRIRSSAWLGSFSVSFRIGYGFHALPCKSDFRFGLILAMDRNSRFFSLIISDSESSVEWARNRSEIFLESLTIFVSVGLKLVRFA